MAKTNEFKKNKMHYLRMQKFLEFLKQRERHKYTKTNRYRKVLKKTRIFIKKYFCNCFGMWNVFFCHDVE
jgi:thiamine kinase-like enzyme